MVLAITLVDIKIALLNYARNHKQSRLNNILNEYGMSTSHLQHHRNGTAVSICLTGKNSIYAANSFLSMAANGKWLPVSDWQIT